MSEDILAQLGRGVVVLHLLVAVRTRAFIHTRSNLTYRDCTIVAPQ
jgi:hypothetical protein